MSDFYAFAGDHPILCVFLVAIVFGAVFGGRGRE